VVTDSVARSSLQVALASFTAAASLYTGFTAAYVPLMLRFGYSYEFHVILTVVFASLGVPITFLVPMFRVKGFESLSRMSVVFGFLVGVVLLEELLLNSALALYGLVFSIFGLVSIPVLAVWLGRGNGWLRVALEAVALVFATRVVLSPFRLGFLDLAIFLPTIYTLILAGLILYMTYRRVSARDARISLGRRGFVPQLGMGLAFGLIIGFLEYFVLRPQPILAGASTFQMLAYILIVLTVMVGVVEELLFRGLLQSSLEKVMPVWQAIGLTSIIFGLMHVGWMNPLEVLLAYGAGVAFGCLAVATDSLVSPIVAHGFGNLLLYLIALYPL